MAINYDDLKKGGFLKQKQKDTFIVRFRSIAGNLSSENLRQLADLADKYGKGYVHVTTRQGTEIPWVNLNDYEKMNKEIRDLGLHTGTCGPRIRTVVACPGNEVCSLGLMNSREAAVELDKAFFGRQVPMKTKIAVSGCPNSCAKPQENDIGLVGAIEPVLCEENCVGCGICQDVCPNEAISMVDGKPQIDRSRCLMEGNCIFSCPTDAWQEKRRGYLLYAGGKIGRKPRLGQVIAKFIPQDNIVEAVSKVLKAFTSLSVKGERIADTITRVGTDAFIDKMEAKDEGVEQKGGGCCG